MSNHFSADNLKFPGDDRRLDLTDVFMFTSPDDPDTTVVIMDSNPTSAPPPIPIPAPRLEHEDLGALVAPRPMLVESGTEDDLFPVAAAAESLRRTRLVYEQEGAGERLVHDVFEGGHQWHGTEAMPFLDRWLGHDGGGPDRPDRPD